MFQPPPVGLRRNSHLNRSDSVKQISPTLPKFESPSLDNPDKNGTVIQSGPGESGVDRNESFLNTFSDFMTKMSKPKDYCGELSFSLYYNDSFQYLRIYLSCAKNLLPMDSSGYSDPYVIMKLIPDKKRRHKSSVRFKTLNPKWEEEFYFRNLDYHKMFGSVLRLTVMDYDRMSPDDPIG